MGQGKGTAERYTRRINLVKINLVKQEERPQERGNAACESSSKNHVIWKTTTTNERVARRDKLAVCFAAILAASSQRRGGAGL